jgi:hypothetical protein
MRPITLATLCVLAATQNCSAITINFDPPGVCCNVIGATDIDIDGVMYDFFVETVPLGEVPANANHGIGGSVVNAINQARYPYPNGVPESGSVGFRTFKSRLSDVLSINQWRLNDDPYSDDGTGTETQILRTWYEFTSDRIQQYMFLSDEDFASFVSTWGYGVPIDQDFQLGDELLSNAGFDADRDDGGYINTVGLPTEFRKWGGDWTYIATITNATGTIDETGIVPIGEGMLNFINTTPSQSITDPGVGSTSDILQYVDLSPFAQYDGQLTGLLSASFNRVAGDEQTDTEFALVLAAHQGTPENSPGQATSMAHEISYLITDGDVETWEQLSVELTIPAGADFLQVTLAAIENVFDDFGYLAEFDGHFADAASLILYIRGDTDMDGSIDVKDIDTLSGMIRIGDYDRLMDLDRDGSLTTLDRHILVNDLMQTTYGDANLDGQFNSSDLIDVLASGTYETDVDSTWATGDWDGDGRTTSGDLVTALATGNYEAGQLAAVAAVPEPTNVLLLIVGLAAVSLSSSWRRRPLRQR